jgi:hypothetical protein
MNALIKPNIIKDKKTALLIHEKLSWTKNGLFLSMRKPSWTKNGLFLSMRTYHAQLSIHSCARELIMHKK